MTGDRGPNERLIGVPGSRNALETPALVLDLDAVEANIASSVEHATTHGYDLRPVVKIHKSTRLAKHQIAAAGVGVCCSTLGECEAMVRGGLSRMLLFSPTVSEAKLARLADLNADASDLLLVADDPLHIDMLTRVARRSGRPVQILVDLEVGGLRTGLSSGGAIRLAQLVSRTRELEFVGLHAYVGTHQKIIDYESRRSESHRLLAPLAHTIDELTRIGLSPRVVSGGGTGTHDIDPELGLLTEIQIGSYVLMDGSYKDVVLRRNEAHPFRPALWVRTAVLSTAKPGIAVTDAGMKELAGITSIDGSVILRGAPQDAKYVLVGDDLGRIQWAADDTTPLRIGDTVDVMPRHCYQAICHYAWYHVVRDDCLIDIWPIDALPSW